MSRLVVGQEAERDALEAFQFFASLVSLAAFAPVGQTGYVVVVETLRHAVQRDGRALLHKLAWRAGIPLAVGLLLLGLWVFPSVRRKHSCKRAFAAAIVLCCPLPKRLPVESASARVRDSTFQRRSSGSPRKSGPSTSRRRR